MQQTPYARQATWNTTATIGRNQETIQVFARTLKNDKRQTVMVDVIRPQSPGYTALAGCYGVFVYEDGSVATDSKRHPKWARQALAVAVEQVRQGTIWS